MAKRTVLSRISLANIDTRLEIDWGHGEAQECTVTELIDNRRGRGARVRVDGAFDTTVIYDEACADLTITVVPR